MTERRFPPGFIWGTATSSYQIEGATEVGGRGPSIWDTFAKRKGAVKDGLDGSIACDHWHRWPDDVALMKSLGVGAYRLSISWPRVFPTGLEKAPLTKGLDQYERIIDGLLEAGIDPWVTLYHWDLPQGLEDLGGWPDRQLVDHFVRYAEAVVVRMADRVGHWVTHNEPWCTAFLGYGLGVHAPGRTDMGSSLAAAHHILLSHGRTVPLLREILPDTAKIGITLNLKTAYAASDSEADQQAARHFDGFFNRWYLDALAGKGYPEDVVERYRQQGHFGKDVLPFLRRGDMDEIASPIDFLGVNYYDRQICRSDVVPEVDNAPRSIPEPPPEVLTTMGWEVYPDGLYEMLTRLHRDYPQWPIAITENGCAYDTGPGGDGEVHDAERVEFLHGHLDACSRAIADGADLQAYFAWSLMDNFEWQEGYTQRFGIIFVDYDTLERVPKDSYKWYARAIAANAVVSV